MRRVLIGAVRGWRRFISPLYGPRCRYHPSCSAYALGALEQHGAVRGTGLAVWRVLRCNPLSDGGYDPVPERSTRSGRDRRTSTGPDPLADPGMSDDRSDSPHVGGPTAGSHQPVPMAQPVPMTPSAVPVTAAAGDARP